MLNLNIHQRTQKKTEVVRQLIGFCVYYGCIRAHNLHEVLIV